LTTPKNAREEQAIFIYMSDMEAVEKTNYPSPAEQAIPEQILVKNSFAFFFRSVTILHIVPCSLEIIASPIPISGDYPQKCTRARLLPTPPPLRSNGCPPVKMWANGRILANRQRIKESGREEESGGENRFGIS
jgi:hypothetical protein